MGRPLAEATAHPPEPDRAPAEAKNRRLDQAFASLPGAIHTTQVSNPSPTEFILPLALFSPPGSRLLQQLIDYDLLVRRTLLARHLGLITQAEKRDFIATIPRLMPVCSAS